MGKEIDQITTLIEEAVSRNLKSGTMNNLIISAAMLEMFNGFFNDYDYEMASLLKKVAGVDIIPPADWKTLSKKKQKWVDNTEQSIAKAVIKKNTHFKAEIDRVANIIDTLPESKLEMLYEMQDVVVTACDLVLKRYTKNIDKVKAQNEQAE